MTSGSHSPEVDSAGQLAAKLNHLIGLLHPDPSNRPGFTRLAEDVREVTGSRLSGTYLWQLATGRKRNPTLEQMEVLAKFFGVPSEYFHNDAVTDDINAQINLALALRDAKVRDIALRAKGLPPQTLDAILTVIAAARDKQVHVSDKAPDEQIPPTNH